MSRIANAPISLPKGVEISLQGPSVNVKGPKGSLSYRLPKHVTLSQEDGTVYCKPQEIGPGAVALAGTARSILNGMVVGVSEGFEKRLTLVGVGYRAQMQGKSLNLTLGYSHPIDFPLPEGTQIETPSQTEIVVRGFDKQLVGQVAAKIRGFRPPEPYKGKGVRYSDENVARKEAKKK
ncbi:MAG TPA: 50S ribosomal protein L6 [Gammaproteobacteria bacterium]|nr:50S ribosomal protein L6 [Gammaproteobacteria bacterium]